MVEVGESYFEAKRIRRKRGRGAAGKTPFWGLLKHGGNELARLVPDCSRERLLPIIQALILEGATIYSDGTIDCSIIDTTITVCVS